MRIDVDEAGFETEVIARSREVPVVVDFWAEWCGPCRMLGPVLEREIAATGGRVELKKVDTDGNPKLSQSFGIRSIPAVKAFKDGKVVAEFEGARDAAFLRAWLEQLAPSPAKLALAEAAKLLDAGRAAEAAALLDRPDLGDEPIADALRLRVSLWREAEAAGGEAAARATLAADARDLDAHWHLAGALAGKGDLPGAIDTLLAIVSRSRKFKDDGARRAILALLAGRPADDDLARDTRRRLQVLL
jgi:putative thioredoxin